jgi:hypothetical protein
MTSVNKNILEETREELFNRKYAMMIALAIIRSQGYSLATSNDLVTEIEQIANNAIKWL